VVVRHGSGAEVRPGVEGAVLLSPPLRSATDADLDAWALDGRPLVAVVPEFDDYLRPAQAVTRFARVPNARVVAVPAAKHLFVGHAEAALDEVVRPVLPDRVPLPRHWPPGGA
jgi:hypothetical protein